MLARIRKAAEEKDSGFTLIELLVVMIIIGILAAIAIPVFLNQRKKAVDTSIKSDLRTVANEMETYYTDAQAYVAPSQGSAGGDVAVGSTNVKVSKDNVIGGVMLSDATHATATASASTGFCLTGTNAKGSDSDGWIYNSLTGGLKKAGTGVSCPAAP